MFGCLSDLYARYRMMGLIGAIGLCLSYRLFLWVLVSPMLVTQIVSQTLAALAFYCGYDAAVPSFLAELSPTRRRTHRASIAYVLAQLAFAAVSSPVASSLIKATGNAAAPGLCLVGVTRLSRCCLVTCRRLAVTDGKVPALLPIG